jgi:hypothetical protein
MKRFPDSPVLWLVLLAALGLGGFGLWSGERHAAGATESRSAAARPGNSGAKGAPEARAGKRTAREQPEWRSVLHDDGTRTDYRRTLDKRVVIKRHFEADGLLQTTTVYLVGKGNKILSGRIYDGRGEDLYRCRYGYSMPAGELVEEQVQVAGEPAPLAPGELPEPAFRVVYTRNPAGKVESRLLELGASAGSGDGATLRKGPGFDRDGKPKGIPSAPFEIPLDEL